MGIPGGGVGDALGLRAVVDGAGSKKRSVSSRGILSSRYFTKQRTMKSALTLRLMLCSSLRPHEHDQGRYG